MLIMFVEEACRVPGAWPVRGQLVVGSLYRICTWALYNALVMGHITPGHSPITPNPPGPPPPLLAMQLPAGKLWQRAAPASGGPCPGPPGHPRPQLLPAPRPAQRGGWLVPREQQGVGEVRPAQLRVLMPGLNSFLPPALRNWMGGWLAPGERQGVGEVRPAHLRVLMRGCWEHVHAAGLLMRAY